jgi:hypothetical protein
MPSWFYCCLLIPTLFGSFGARRDVPTVVPHPAKVAFGSEIVFSATAQSVEPVRDAKLVVEDSFSKSAAYSAEIIAGDGYSLTARRDLQAEPVFPFSSIGYWWEVRFASGETIVSPRQSLQYLDDRYSWQTLRKGRATVGWVEGDSRAAEDAADLLLLDLGTISADLDSPIPDGVSLYIYPRLADFQFGLGKLISGWEGALSDPASGIILLAAASGAEGRESLAALIPHEAVHILLGAKWKDAYALLPLWLVEGTAAGYETESRPEADRALQEAAAGGNLIPMAALCRTFPSDKRPALLAYAESKSFVAFLRQTYGLAAGRAAMDSYAAGAACPQGWVGPTGKSVDALEGSWRAQLRGSGAWLPVPWLLVLGAAVLLGVVLAAGWVIRRRKGHSRQERKQTE